jgi:hypothetical protein
MLQVAEPGAAPLFLDRDAMEAEGAHLRPQLARKPVVAVDPLGERRDPLAGEIGDRGAEHIGRGSEEVGIVPVAQGAFLPVAGTLCHPGSSVEINGKAGRQGRPALLGRSC